MFWLLLHFFAVINWTVWRETWILLHLIVLCYLHIQTFNPSPCVLDCLHHLSFSVFETDWREARVPTPASADLALLLVLLSRDGFIDALQVFQQNIKAALGQGQSSSSHDFWCISGIESFSEKRIVPFLLLGLHTSDWLTILRDTADFMRQINFLVFIPLIWVSTAALRSYTNRGKSVAVAVCTIWLLILWVRTERQQQQGDYSHFLIQEPLRALLQRQHSLTR